MCGHLNPYVEWPGALILKHHHNIYELYFTNRKDPSKHVVILSQAKSNSNCMTLLTLAGCLTTPKPRSLLMDMALITQDIGSLGTGT